jgi:hypothetical protein
MCKLLKYFLLIIFISCFISSCDKDDIWFFSVKRKLEKNTWKINSCINSESNSNYFISGATYVFKKNGDFLIYPENSEEIKKTTWQLTDKDKYLRIGTIILKLKLLLISCLD